MQRKGNPCALLVRMQIGLATMESSTGLPQKIRNETALSTRDSTFEIYPKKRKRQTQNKTHGQRQQCVVGKGVDIGQRGYRG